MLAIEPLRVGKTYMFDSAYVVNNIPPWDEPEGLTGPQYDRYEHAMINEHYELAWSLMLRSKRRDRQYRAVVYSVQEWGWLRPLTLRVDEAGAMLSHGDGHHRLAAAIDLGVVLVPYTVHVEGDWDAVSPDSGEYDPQAWNVELTEEQRATIGDV